MAQGAEPVVQLTLDFDCCGCGAAAGVTVKCGGQGFTTETDNATRVASTSVPCPACGLVNQLFFDPTGAVHSVKPLRCFRPLPTPSVN